MILHISNSDKFIPPLINFLNEEFNFKVNTFYIFSDANHSIDAENVNWHRYNSSLGYMKAVFAMLKADKIILHGLFNNRINLIFILLPFLLRKTYWVIWGGDLYKYRQPRKSLKSHAYEFVRYLVIRKMGYLISLIPGDIILARQWYKSQGASISSIIYLSNTIDRPEIIEGQRKILLGNSATPTNHHIEAMKILKSESDLLSWDIVVPLSYGDADYAKEVISEGRDIFGNNFKAITSFLTLQDYLQLLSSVSIAIFAHDRQQGMGNILNLLGMGKTVVLRRGVSHTDYLEEMGFKFRYLDEKITEISYADKVSNVSIVRRFYSREVLVKEWQKIISSTF